MFALNTNQLNKFIESNMAHRRITVKLHEHDQIWKWW